MNILKEFLNIFSDKGDDKYELPDIEDKDKVLPNSEEPELPILRIDSFHHSISFDEEFKNIKSLIRTYREVATNHEIDNAINDIINEAIVVEDNKNNISLNLDDVEGISDNIKEKIIKEFKDLLSILNFKRNGSNLFREWYIDGRLWFQVLFHKTNSKGISKIRKLSPLDITRVKEEKDGKIYYIYKEDEINKNKRRKFFNDISNRNFQEGVQISSRNIVFVPSGLTDPESKIYISHLHKAIKPLNQLKLLEDSAVIYRMTRAPERRVFYIDVGKLPHTKAENYVKGLMNNFKSTVKYDVKTGKVTQNKKVMTMLEDLYLPTRGDTKGTKVETLEGGRQLGEIDDILYFRRKLFASLQVPFSRSELGDNAPVVDIGRQGELTRPELKFQKFINRLKSNFSVLFIELLKIQLITKNIIKIGEWETFKNDIDFIWQTDNYFEELKQNEILTQRLELLENIKEHIGEYFSSLWVKKNVLRQTDNDIKEMDKQIKDSNDREEEEVEVEVNKDEDEEVNKDEEVDKEVEENIYKNNHE